MQLLVLGLGLFFPIVLIQIDWPIFPPCIDNRATDDGRRRTTTDGGRRRTADDDGRRTTDDAGATMADARRDAATG